MIKSVLGVVAVLFALSQAPTVSHRDVRLTFWAAQSSTVTVRQVWGEAPFLGDWRSAISPNGRYLAYAGPGQGPRLRALYVRDLLAGVSRPLTTVDPTGFVVSIVFSPDETLVAYTWYDGERDDLRRVMLDGSAAPRFSYRSDEWPHLALVGWSSDGEHMLLAVKTGPLSSETLHFGLMSVANGSIRILKTFALPYFPSMRGFSPDGRYALYDHPARGDSGERDIFILDIRGGFSAGYNGRETRLVTRPADDRRPRFTPDGRGAVFFSSGAAGEPNSAWYQRVVDGRPQGSPELLRQDMGPDAEPIGFTSNGSFYYHIKSDSSNMRAVWVMENFLPAPPGPR